MAHSEHNRSRRGGSFALVILGAILLFLAPNIYPSMPEVGISALAGGLVVGGIGFYKIFQNRRITN